MSSDEFLKRAGIEDPKNVYEQYRKDPDGTIHELWDRIRPQAEAAMQPKFAKWAVEDHLLEGPISGPIPIELVGEFEPDPLRFTLVFEHQPYPAEVAAMTAAIESLSEAETLDEDDSIAYMSEITGDTLPGTGAPTLTWWYDAANTSPGTIRRLIDGTAVAAATSGVPVFRLLIGRLDQLA
jgi:hypothetical protein